MTGSRLAWPAGVLAVSMAIASVATAQSTAGQALVPKGAQVCVKPVIGPPANITEWIGKGLRKRLSASGVVVSACPPTDTGLAVVGYFLSAKETGGVKVSYIVEVAIRPNPSLGRVTGVYMLPPAPDSVDPWAALTEEIAERMGDAAAARLLR